MKIELKHIAGLVLAGFACTILATACKTGNNELNAGPWKIGYNVYTKGLSVCKDSMLVFNGIYASFKLSGRQFSAHNYSKHTIRSEKLNDSFGKGYLYQVTYTGNNLPVLCHSFYIYPERDYILTDFTLESKEVISCNYMAPVNIDKMANVLNEGQNNRALFIPFDNDKWIRYQSHPLTFDSLTSYEVTAIFNNDDRHGIVTGSVEHDVWKTAVVLGKGDNTNIGSLCCFGGAADEQTRDSNPHGSLTGKKIRSPKILIGYFDDWRYGLEEYARANAVLTPPRKWEKAVPFGWNSWGALKFDLTYPKALEVSDFFKENLQHNHFINADQTLYIGLDSGWNSFSEEQLKAFADRCKANGQKAGIYWTPFTDWGRNPEKTFEAAPGYKYKDVYLLAGSQPQELDGAYALDPTHPAVEAAMKQTSELFRRTGFEYVKMDFMTHGAMEADRWYKPEISTGMQAYNYGMQLLNRYFADMYINLSISPVFPAQYAQSRRIACDAWNKIKDSEYTMNAVSYGWWQNLIYSYNDADHIVLADATEGENRARITSGVITGIYITGDDFSREGNAEGKERARKYFTNADVNRVANGITFRPVEGNGRTGENEFVRANPDGSYNYALFNYSEQPLTKTVSLPRLGLIPRKEYRLRELWSGRETIATDSVTLTVAPADAYLFSINP